MHTGILQNFAIQFKPKIKVGLSWNILSSNITCIILAVASWRIERMGEIDDIVADNDSKHNES